MNLVPEFLRPFGLSMLLLVTAMVLSLAVVLHRAVNFAILKGRLSQLNQALAAQIRSLRDGRLQAVNGIMTPLIDFCRRDDGLEAYHRQYLLPPRRVDEWVDRGLAVLIAVGPMLGLAGTVQGIMETFAAFASHSGPVSLNELGGPVSTALKTTLYGVVVAAACTSVRGMFPIPQLRQEERNIIEHAWPELQAAFDEVRRPKPRSVTPLTPDVDKHEEIYAHA